MNAIPNDEGAAWSRDGQGHAARLLRMTDAAEAASPRLDEIADDVLNHLGEDWKALPAVNELLAAALEGLDFALAEVAEAVKVAKAKQARALAGPPEWWALTFG
ncbi:MAG: hypothetical protein ACYDGR_03595 [Candidatus Dormibacteria bacterium]